MDQRYEGMAVSLVRPGLQRRLAVILYGKSFLRFLYERHAAACLGHIKLQLLVRAQSEVVRACCLSGVGSLSRQSWAFLERWIPASANHDGPVTLADQLARSLAHFR